MIMRERSWPWPSINRFREYGQMLRRFDSMLSALSVIPSRCSEGLIYTVRAERNSFQRLASCYAANTRGAAPTRKPDRCFMIMRERSWHWPSINRFRESSLANGPYAGAEALDNWRRTQRGCESLTIPAMGTGWKVLILAAISTLSIISVRFPSCYAANTRGAAAKNTWKTIAERFQPPLYSVRIARKFLSNCCNCAIAFTTASCNFPIPRAARRRPASTKARMRSFRAFWKIKATSARKPLTARYGMS
jgi:hypothetical protein